MLTDWSENTLFMPRFVRENALKNLRAKTVWAKLGVDAVSAAAGAGIYVYNSIRSGETYIRWLPIGSCFFVIAFISCVALMTNWFMAISTLWLWREWHRLTGGGIPLDRLDAVNGLERVAASAQQDPDGVRERFRRAREIAIQLGLSTRNLRTSDFLPSE